MKIKTWMMAGGLAVCLLVQPAVGEQFEDGVAAYDRGDYATALQLFQSLADQGLAEAQFDLAILYANGQGVAQDYVEAAKWYRLAAEQGVAGAQFNLGLLYEFGHGIPQDYASAEKWYRLAAEQSVAQAFVRLAVMYYKGQGVQQDFIQAYVWGSLGAAGGFPLSKEARDALSKRMTPDQIGEAQRLVQEWLTAHPKQ